MVSCSLQNVPSQHLFRSQRRHAARLRQEAIIAELRLELEVAKAELADWRVWWQTTFVADGDDGCQSSMQNQLEIVLADLEGVSQTGTLVATNQVDEVAPPSMQEDVGESTMCDDREVRLGAASCDEEMEIVIDADAQNSESQSVDAGRAACDADEPRNVQMSSSQCSTKLLESLRGQPKHEAILNLFLNRTCTRDNYQTTMNDMRKYYSDDLQHLAKFLGTKFGIGSKSWEELESTLCVAVQEDSQWDPGLTLGMVLAELHRQKSETSKAGPDRNTQLTNRVTQPKKNKRKDRKCK